MKRMLFESGEGIGNNVHATGVIYAILDHPALTDIYVRVVTKHPELWTPIDDRLEVVTPDRWSEEVDGRFDYWAWGLFRIARLIGQEETWAREVVKCRRLPDGWEQYTEARRIGLGIEQHFGVTLDCWRYRRVAVDGIVMGMDPMTVGLVAGGTRSHRWRYKHWPTEKWTELAKRLSHRGYYTLGFHAEDEDLIPGCDGYVCRQGLPVVAAELLGCGLVVGNDCGLLHMANALRVPCVGIYGPTGIPKNLVRGVAAVVSSGGCAPCQDREHDLVGCQTGKCMDLVEVDQVLSACLAVRDAALGRCHWKLEEQHYLVEGGKCGSYCGA